MKIQLVTFGKIKNKEARELIDYYLQLAGKYVKTELIQLKEIQTKVNLNDLGNIIEKDCVRIVMSEDGKEFTTEEFTAKLKTFQMSGKDIQIIIGSAFGVAEELKSYSDIVLSLGKMTYPHELSLVLITEQIFRCYNLLAGGKYHK